MQLTTAAPEVSGVLLRLPGTGTVTGRVTDETGRAVSGAAIRAAGGTVNTDPDGYYTLLGLREGTLSISASDPITGMSGGTTATVRLGQVTAGANITILRPAFVEGRVFKIDEGETTPKPLAGAKVTSNGFNIVETDSQGHYRLENVPTGSVLLRFVDEEKALAANMTVTLSPGETLTRDATIRSGTIRGRITQPDGVTGVIADVAVYAQRASLEPGFGYGVLTADPPSLTRSAADGSYSLTGLNPGVFRVTASNVFFPTHVSGGGALAPGGTAVCDLSLVSTLAGKIQGRVYQPDGVTPAPAGTRVALGGGSLADAAVRTDETGHYEFGEVFSAGGYTLTATDPTTGYTNRVGVSVQKNKDAVFDLRLLGTGNLKVRVVDGAGQPVTSGSVTIDGSKFPNQSRFAELTPDGGGVVEFTNLPEGPYGVAASDQGLGSRVSVKVPLGASVETTIQLQASGTVAGRVLMPDGTTPVGLADVELRVAGRSVGFAITSDDEADRGTFKFLSVPSGGFTLDVFDNRTGRVGRSGGRIVTQGETATVDVTLVSVGAVSGRVTANGQPVDHALVQIYADGSGIRSEHLQATTDADGHYRFTGIPAGRVRVDVSEGPGGQGGSATGTVSGTVEPLPDTVIDVVLEPSQTVTGTVFNPGGTEPLPGAQVVIYINGREFHTATNESGVYRLGYLPLGQVQVRAEAPTGYDRGESATVQGTQVGATLTVNLTLAGVGAVAGIASDSNGSPLAVGTVTYTNDAWYPPIVLNVPVLSGGRYEITDLPAGPFRLSLTAPNRVGGGTASGTIVAGQSIDLPIRLEDAGRVLGTAKTADGSSPVTGADVTLTLSRPGFYTTFYTHTNSSGAWSFENVLLGTVTVNVSDPLTGAVGRVKNLSLATNGQTLDVGEIRVRDNKYGAVAGTVINRNNQPFPGALVTLHAPNGTLTATTGPDGRYHFEPVDLGSFTVEATDPEGFLHDRQTGQLANDDQTASVELRLAPRGTLTGVITRSDGTTTVAGAQVVVQTSGTFGPRTLASGVTDAQGRYTFELIPTDITLHVEATDPATGDRGYADTQINDNGDTVTLNLSLRGLGTAVVTVMTSAGDTRVENAHVRLRMAFPPYDDRFMTTQFNGTATFDGVLVGNYEIVVTDTETGLSGTGTITVAQNTTANVTVRLQPSGTITGRVLAPDGATPVTGVTVRLDENGPGTVTGFGGVFRFEHLPFRSYQLSAFDIDGRLRARVADIPVGTDGEVVTRDLVLEALGSVAGHVTFADGSEAGGATVSLRVDNPNIGEAFNGAVTADASGAFRFNSIPVGQFTATAVEPGGLRATASGEVVANAEVNVDLRLEEAGRISGRVYAPDGVTPVAGVRLDLAYTGRQTTSRADGSYEFDGLPFGYYFLFVYDEAGHLRATSQWTEVAHGNGQVTIDFTLIGTGSVTGRVLFEDGTPAGQVPLYLEPHDVQVYDGYQSGVTDDAGFYRFDNVSVGTYGAIVNDEGRRLFGQVEVTLEQDGQTATAPDIRLIANKVNLPVNRYDANGMLFDINPDGTSQRGTNWMYYANGGGFNLELVADGVTHHFDGNGQGYGSGEENDREIAVRQQGLAGLDVTRKVYVPREGYFVRYLELLHNPTASPVTVSVKVRTNLRRCQFWWDYGCGGASVISTSSGDDVLDAADAANPDRWVVLDNGQDIDPYYENGMPASSYAFDGAGAAERAAAASYDPGTALELAYQWDSVTIQPNATVAYMHFGSAQTSRAAAQASVERLVQLPPEALAGLSAEERAEVRNFAVPADGTSTLAALPGFSGHVTGRVLAADNTTPIAGGNVEFHSNNILFGRTLIARADGDGLYTFEAYNWEETFLISLDSFTLATTHPQTNRRSPDIVGSFPAGQTSVTQNIVFDDTGTLRGVVRRHTGAPVVGGGSVSIQSDSVGLGTSVFISSDGSYKFAGIPGGDYTVTAAVNHSQGQPLLSSPVTVTVNAGETQTTDLSLRPTGTITGTVRKADGTPASLVTLRIAPAPDYSYSYRTARTNGFGVYTFNDVPAGGYRLTMFEPSTGDEHNVDLNVAQDETVTQDMTLYGVGSVQVTVNRANGTAAANSVVQIKYGSYPYFRWAGYTNAQGKITIQNIQTGPFTVQASNPSNERITAEVTGTLATNGATESVTVTLPATGTVRGRVTLGNGGPASGTTVRLYYPDADGLGGYELYAYTNANGEYEFADAEAGRAFNVIAQHPNNYNLTREVSNQVVQGGQTLTVDISFPPSASLRVTVNKTDGTPMHGARISVRDSESNGQQRDAGNTDENGVVVIDDVAVGDFTVTAFIYVYDGGEGTREVYVGTARGTLVASNQGQTVDVLITEVVGGTVQVNVRRAGQPRPGVYVRLWNVSTDTVANQGYTDEQGAVTFTDVRVGEQGFRVAAETQYGNAEATGSFATPGESVTVNLTLPGGFVSGRVLYADGTTPVPNASVWATQELDGSQQVYYGNSGDDGSYTIEGVRAGDFTLYAQPQGSALTGTAAANLSDESAAFASDITLPPSGTVRGTVRNAAGQSLAGALVTMTSADSQSEMQVWADEHGVYQFARSALGDFYVQARDTSTNVFGSAGGTLAADGETVTADINIPATMTLSGNVFAANGTTPLSNARVYIESFSNGGAAGRYVRLVVANSAGKYTATGVPAGLLRVTAAHPNNQALLGEAHTTLVAPGPATLNVNLGNVVNVGDIQTLAGADGLRYQFYGGGEMVGGGTEDERLLSPYYSAFALTFQNYWSYGNRVEGLWVPTASVEDGGREYAFGNDTVGGLLVRRKLFVPEGGGFARYLEILQNPTGKPITILVGVDSWFGYPDDSNDDALFNVLVNPSETGNTFALTEFNQPGSRPMLAHVFAGPGARLSPNPVEVGNEEHRGFSRYRLKLTVPAGQTMILMHFTAQQEPGDAAPARARAEALVSLSDPHALDGMSEEERAAVYNFQVPVQSGVRNEIRKNKGSRVADAAGPRRDGARAADAASTGGGLAREAGAQTPGLRVGGFGRQGLERR